MTQTEPFFSSTLVFLDKSVAAPYCNPCPTSLWGPSKITGPHGFLCVCFGVKVLVRFELIFFLLCEKKRAFLFVGGTLLVGAVAVVDANVR